MIPGASIANGSYHSCTVSNHHTGHTIPEHYEQNRYPFMQHPIVALAMLIFIAFSDLARADLTGKVVHITDGDNLTVIINNEWVRVRLAGIDAPETNQPFGTRSKQSLTELCFWKNVTVSPNGKDQYGRMFAKVRCLDVYAGEEQVRRGMAWVYDRYVEDPTLDPLQNEAQAAKRGLWSDPYSSPPWEWREIWK